MEIWKKAAVKLPFVVQFQLLFCQDFSVVPVDVSEDVEVVGALSDFELLSSAEELPDEVELPLPFDAPAVAGVAPVFL